MALIHTLVDIIKTFAFHVDLPTDNFVKYVESIRPPNIMHSYDSSINLVLHVRTIKYDEEACDV
jgi:hypothetical protein